MFSLLLRRDTPVLGPGSYAVRLSQVVHILYGIAVAIFLLFAAITVLKIVETGCLPFGIDARWVGDNRNVLPEGWLYERADHTQQVVTLKVQPDEQPLLSTLWFVGALGTWAVIGMFFHTLRQVCLGFASRRVFTRPAALSTRRLGVVLMVAPILGFLLERWMSAMADAYVDSLREELLWILPMRDPVLLNDFLWIPLGFFVWILGAALGLAAELQKEAQELV